MLTKEENEFFTRVGPGTPAGELLRRYWHPVSVAQELTEENPTKFVRILGEDLILFQDRTGRVGLIQDHCAHRGASLLYGRVEARGIACAYHGWLYDINGNCLETPAEPADSKLYLTVKAKAYPVQRYVGLHWAYLGPEPAPVIPKYDVWAREDGYRSIDVYPRLDANWFQAMENSADPAHLQILHQETAGGRKPPSTTRGFIDDVDHVEFSESSFGLMKRRFMKTGRWAEHPLIFPNILRQGDATQIRVPMDDRQTNIFFVHFTPFDGSDGKGRVDGQRGKEDSEVTYLEPFKTPADALHPFTRFRLDMVLAQDHMAWETQGPIANRTAERLATSDRGVVMFREMVKREIGRVQQGLDPMGVVRDPDHPIIDTNVMADLAGARTGWAGHGMQG